VALAHRRRASAHDREPAARRLDRRAHLRNIPAARRAQEQWRRPAFRRRAADAGDLARAGDQSASVDHGRADRGAGARHRCPGRGDAGASRRGRRHCGARHRAEHRGGDSGLKERCHHGQRPRQSPDRIVAPCLRPRFATAPARGRASYGSRAWRRSASIFRIRRRRPAGRSRCRSHASSPARGRSRPAC
jgi:hypothetical protein